MNIFFSGDSHTIGSELQNPETESYSAVLTKLLNGNMIANESVGGACNDRILRLTEKFLYTCAGRYPDLIVIGWTEPKRHEWFYEHGNELYETVNSNNLNDDTACQIDQRRFLVEKRMFENVFSENVLAKYWHSKIYNFHLKLTHLKIPHIFFNAHKSFYETVYHRHTDSMIYNDFLNFDWNNRFWNPYTRLSGCFKDWAQENSYPITQYGHAAANAHNRFAHILHEHINTYNLSSI